MGRCTFSLSLLVMLVSGVTFCLSQLTISPQEEIVTPNEMGRLNSVIIVTCELGPETVNISEIESRWTTPSGLELVVGETETSEYLLQLLPIDINGVPGTVLVIAPPISISDSGEYICEARNSTDSSAPWVRSSVRVSILVTLYINESMVTISESEPSVELSCEMRGHVVPDDQLQWLDPDNQRITNEMNGFEIRFQNGSEQFFSTVPPTSAKPTRVSTLKISNPTASHSGNYTCSVQGTQESKVLQLIVDPTTSPPTTTPTPVSTSRTMFPLPAVIGSIAGFLGIVVVVLVVIIVIVSMRKKKGTSVTLITNHDFDVNGAYESASNGNAFNGSSRAKQYAQVDKSYSPPPPLPARPSTNLSLSVGNSINSVIAEPQYDTPDLTFSGEKSGSYNPYDVPEEVNPQPSKTNYEELDVLDKGDPTKTYLMSTVPSPAAVLSGSLQRNILDHGPDFHYPFNNALRTDDLTSEKDIYDQIYSEPVDPDMFNQEQYEFEMGNNEALPYSAIYEDPQPLQDGVTPLKVTDDNIIEVRKLGTGQFGHVILAKTQGISLKDMNLSETDNDRNQSILVAIKKLKPDAESCLMEAFDKEVKFMSRLNHDNVIRLLGVCTGKESFIMMEYMENGDLNQFLQKQKLMPDTISGLQENEVTPIILLYMGVQIASGMHYLASHRFVHRDLATRNCLVGKDFIVKISDFGMSRSLYESAYYRVQGTLVLPIRWMACETFYGKFSVKSDAWAFGVALWEIYTLGKVDPYDDMTDEEVIADAIRGPDRRLPEKPEACPRDVYDIMQRCWIHEPSMRADFGTILPTTISNFPRESVILSAPTPTVNLPIPTVNSPTPTVNATEPTITNQRNGPPLSVIVVVVIITVSIIIVILLAIIVMICSLGIGANRAAKKKGAKRKHKETTYTPDARPLYAQVIRPDGSLRRQREIQSASPIHNEEENNTPELQLEQTHPEIPQPREILATSANASHRFRPLPPPPIVNGITQTWSVPNVLNKYSSPSESVDGDGSIVSAPVPLPQSGITTAHQQIGEVWARSLEPYYDCPEAVQHDKASLTSSLQPLVSSASDSASEGYYQRPNSRPATLPRKIPDIDYDYTYKEKLEPSMLQPSTSFESGQGLPFAPIYDTPRPLRNSERPLEIGRQNVVEIRTLGFGHFGKVVLGATTGLSLRDLRLGDNDDKSCSLLVAIKKLRHDADMTLKQNFQKELKFISRLKHPNVVRLLGVCTAIDDSFLIMEYMENGDLHSFLNKQTLVADTVEILGENDITPLILLYIAVQVASGMKYLASKKFVHRDLATRNCLVGRDFVVKISDFGMSCNLYDSLYYRVQGRLILPIRWMAFECFYGKFSVKSDIWAFGIVVWEIYTLAKNEPYYEMSDEEYISNAIKGAGRSLLDKPELCPSEIYEVMKRCWVHEPNMRADFEEIYSRLFLTYTKMSKETG